jgi:hypothetical protein
VFRIVIDQCVWADYFMMFIWNTSLRLMEYFTNYITNWLTKDWITIILTIPKILTKILKDTYLPLYKILL